MKSVNMIVGMLVFAVSHLVIYFIRNLKVAAIFGVSLITLIGLAISGELPSIDIVTGLWMAYAAIGYAAFIAITGMLYTVYEMLTIIKMEKQGKDITASVMSLRKSVYNIPGWSFRDNMSK